MPQPFPQISDDKTSAALSQKLGEIRKKELTEEKKIEAESFGFKFVKLTGKSIPSSALSLISKGEAEKYNVIPYFKDNLRIKIAALEPQSPDIAALAQKLEQETKRKVEIAGTSEESIAFGLKEYGYLPTVSPIGLISLKQEDIESLTSQIEDYRQIADKVRTTSLSKFLNLTLAAALRINASDIHFQPEAKRVSVRFRIDGVLHEIFSLEKDQYNEIKKRFKLISKLKLNIENKPQDGGFTIHLNNTRIDMRLSCLPTNYGESIVTRILNPESIELKFESLGLRSTGLLKIQEAVKKPTGMIIACGPTGSGKTTTLYAILKVLNTEDRQIITLENPIEYKLEGILQTEAKGAISFAEGLKAALRQDPDIIMVGEIRDLETAETAINAALTGHLVITTLHTNSAAGALPRFLAMGVKPFLIGPSVNIIIGQRLARKLCEHCKKETELEPELMNRVKKELEKLPPEHSVDLGKSKFYSAPGCPKCSGFGLKGRIGLYEVLKMDETIVSSIQKGELNEYVINDLALKQGMITIVQDGLLKALEGVTTVEEVFRVAD